MASWPQVSATATVAGHPRDINLDTTLQWNDRANNSLIRVDLPGFKKEEFRVLVYPSGKLTICGQRTARNVRVNKEFQLPSTADLKRITARFDGSTLHLTVPELQVGTEEMVRARMLEARTVAWCETEMEKERSKWDVIATAVAAFALGAIFTHKLFLARNS